MTPGRVPLDFAALAGPVARALLGDPNPRMSSARELRYRRKGSLAVRLDTGQWFDHESGDGGGVLDLVARVQGGDRAAAVRWIESQGSGDRVRAREGDSEAVPRMTACYASRPRESAHAGGEEASRRDSARRLWESTLPIAGTAGAAYLESRGVGHVAGAAALRFHPGITHPHAPGRFPAMVAHIQDASGGFMGVHRTYLDGARKGNLDPPRASLGPIGGGAVRLVELAGDALLLAEGIETAAAAVLVLDWRGDVWAALSTSGLKAVVLPQSVRRVLIAADRDRFGGGQKAAAALGRRLKAEGRRVECWLPSTFCDFNDELMAMGGS